MSKINLRVRFNNKLYSIVLNDYRVSGCKWNDIEHGKCIEYPVNKEDVFVALGVDKTIADLQSQLDQANERLNKKDEEFGRLSCDYKTLLSHYNVLNEKAIVPKFSSGQIVYFANIVEGTVNKFNYMCEDKYNYVVEDKTGEVFIRMKERTFATEQEAQAKLQELRGGE